MPDTEGGGRPPEASPRAAPESGDGAARRRVVAVVGAGRSGTSAITRGLAALGVPLGDKLRRGGGKNPTGFFEDEDLLRLSQRLKRTLGLRGDSLSPIEPETWASPALRRLVAEGAELVERRFGHYPLWGFKYGRALRFLPFWLEVFAEAGLEPSFAFALRNPLSVARSRMRLEPRRGVQARSDLEWLVNVVPYGSRLRGHRIAAVDYDLLMADPMAQLRRLGRLLDLPRSEGVEAAIDAYARRFLQSELRHSRFDPDDLARAPGLHPLARRAYLLLRERAVGDEEVWPEEFWREWRAIEEALEALAPALVYIDGIEAERRRAVWNPLSPLLALGDLWQLVRRTDAFQVRSLLSLERLRRAGAPGAATRVEGRR